MTRFLLSQVCRLLLVLLPLWCVTSTAYAQSSTVTGTVTDATGSPVMGATVRVKDTKLGATAGPDGTFSIANVPDGPHTLVISAIGMANQEVSVTVPQGSPAAISVAEDTRDLDEVVVTGVADARTKMESSVAISTISSKQVQMQAPVSAADVLKNVPGVFVNSALGEIRNVVYSRGVSANSTDADKGYYYVSLQEDGLPVTNITFGNYGPDYFYRTDATMKRLEAVRGGTASIFGSNSPGGIFNYVSKTGGKEMTGEVRAKYGYEGNGNYYRTDLNLGGGSADSKWTYNFGGFYRYAQGARNPGYPMNVGGQVKGNVTRNFEKGFVRVYAKYLSDRNGWFEFQPVKNFSDPRLVSGVKTTDSYLPPKTKFDTPFGSATTLESFDPSSLTHSQDLAGGVALEFDLGSGWTLRNNGKYTKKNVNWNSTAQAYPIGLNNTSLHDLFGTRGIYGTYTFSRHGTTEPLAVLQYDPTGTNASGQPTGDQLTVVQNNLPGQNVLNGGVVTQLGLIQLFDINEVMDQAMISKKINNMTFTAGGYFSHSHVDFKNGRAGIGLTTIENQPDMLDVTLTRPNGTQVQVTNPNGWGNLGGQGNHEEHKMDFDQLAGFFGHDWAITDRLNFDWGVRLDHIKVGVTLTAGGLNPQARADNQNAPTYGGVDGNVNTLYDNKWYTMGAPITANKSINAVSYSGGLNFKLTDNSAVYARFSNGKKAPDLAFYVSTYRNNQYNVDNVKPEAQDLKQLELGFKTQRKNFNLFVTPFYSNLSNIYTFTSLIDDNGLAYNSDPIFNQVKTYGVELEGDYTFSSNFNLRAVATWQNSRATKWGVLVSTRNGRADDYVDNQYSGNKADNTPDMMFNVTPTYTLDKFYAFATWKYMGDRPANVANTFTLKAFSTFEAGTGYNFTSRLTLAANVNNLFSSRGVMSWAAPGGFPRAGDRQGYTPAKLEADKANLTAYPDGQPTFFAILVQPRSYYLTLTYSF